MHGSKKQSGSRREYWARLISQWQSSGERQTTFCERLGVSVETFRWWKSQLGKSGGRRASASRPPARRTPATSLIPVALVSDEVREPESLEVVLPGGRAIRVRGDFDPAVLRKVVETLEATTTC